MDDAPTGMIMNSWMSRLLLCVRAAVDDVHHRHRHLHRARAAEVAVSEGRPDSSAAAFGHRHRDGEHGVGTEARLVVGAVEVDQGLVDEGRSWRRGR